jgi:hypothetical protein
MGQETREKIKTSTSFGYQNGIKPEKIRNVKDYIVNENDFIIIAEDNHRTLYKHRNKSNLGRFSMLSDLVDYCEDIQGTVQFGQQFGASIVRDFDSIDFEFSSLKDDYKVKRLKGYIGWMKCIDSDDDYEVKRKDRSEYFLITHKKEQLQGYSLRWYIDYFDLEEVDLNALNIGVWSYSSLVQLSGICVYNQGQTTISNRYTNNIETDIDSYLLNQFDPLNGKKGYVLATGVLSCTNSTEQRKDFVFDITYSKKYRKLLYTKRK